MFVDPFATEPYLFNLALISVLRVEDPRFKEESQVSESAPHIGTVETRPSRTPAELRRLSNGSGQWSICSSCEELKTSRLEVSPLLPRLLGLHQRQDLCRRCSIS